MKTTSTENHNDRAVPILDRQAQFLPHHPRNIKGPYVFCHKNGQRYQAACAAVNGCDAYEIAGYDF